MNAPTNANRRFRLEALETRMLLAAGAADPYASDFNLAMHAVSATGILQASFSVNFGNQQLVLKGDSTESLTIDLSQLPSFITNLDISSFGDVKMIGADQVANLILTSVGTVAAPGLSVTQTTFATDVDSLSAASLGNYAVLHANAADVKPTDMKLTATSLDGTTIYSDLHSLTLTSESRFVAFVGIPGIGPNSDQTLNLTYTPELTAISGIPSSAVHVVLPPVDPIPSTPSTSDNSNTGNTTTGTVPSAPASDPSQIVIVSLPLDDRTRVLVNQLSDLLHSSQDDTQQQVLDLLNHASQTTNHTVNPVLTDVFTSPEVLNLTLLPRSRSDGDLSIPLLGQLGSTKTDARLVDGQNFVGALSHIALTVQDSDATNLPDGVSVKGVVDVDVTWPSAMPSTAPVDVPTPATHKTDDSELSHISIADSVRALGSYIVERVSAEFSPGQQSLVLLVDPQPSRNFGANRKSAAARLSAGAEISIPNANTAAA